MKKHYRVTRWYITRSARKGPCKRFFLLVLASSNTFSSTSLDSCSKLWSRLKSVIGDFLLIYFAPLSTFAGVYTSPFHSFDFAIKIKATINIRYDGSVFSYISKENEKTISINGIYRRTFPLSQSFIFFPPVCGCVGCTCPYKSAINVCTYEGGQDLETRYRFHVLWSTVCLWHCVSQTNGPSDVCI